MSKSDERTLLALVKKNSERAAKAKPKPKPTYDDTLPPPSVDQGDEDAERKAFFSEMKKREF